MSLGQTFIVAIDQMTDEIDPDSGLLKARSGVGVGLFLVLSHMRAASGKGVQGVPAML